MSQRNAPPLVRLHPVGAAEPISFTSTGLDAFTLLEGIEGIGLPPVDHRLTERSGGYGSILRSTHLKEREIFVPLKIMGANQEEVLTAWRRLLDALHPSRGSARLEVRLPGAAPRFIDVLYKEGLKGEFGQKYRKTHLSVGLTLLAPHPLFYGEDHLLSWSPKSSEGKHFVSDSQPFFPLILTPSTVGELTEITIESDQNVTPVWRITGPVTDVKVTHQESGAFFQVRETFKPGEWMVLDVATYDVFDSVHTRGELWDKVADGSTLFQLPPGKNTIRVEATNMTDASGIQLVYKPTYLRGI